MGRRFDKLPGPLSAWFAEVWETKDQNVNLVRLGLRLGEVRARSAAVELLDDARTPEQDRVELTEALGQSAEPVALAKLLSLFTNAPSQKLRNAALSALQNFPDPGIARALADSYGSLSLDLRARVRSVLGSRPTWATVLVGTVERGIIPAQEFAIEEVRQMALLKDAELTQRMEKIWGKVRPDSPEEKRNFINEAKLVLKPSGTAGRDARGNSAEGRKLFAQACGVCHKLFDEGNAIGPDLTTADRRNTEVLLQNIVNPGAYIRPEFISYEAVTKDEQSISGLLVESASAAVTLLDRNNQRHVLPRERLASLRESEVSLMPEGLLEALSPQQLMDLFSYLQSEGTAAAQPSAR
jgi:putative heme-binding domain-containing protein